MDTDSTNQKNNKHRFGFKVAMVLFTFCGIGLGIVYLALALHFSRWEDTEKVKSMTQPAANTLIEKEFKRYDGGDYFETYRIELPQDTGSFKTHIQYILESERPKWFSHLYGVRDAIVGPLGLKTLKMSFDTKVVPTDFIVGEQFRTFKITAMDENEIVFGDEDKHLALFCSISKSTHNGQNYLYVTTLVQFKNVWGSVYFFPVKPIHKLMIKTRLKGYIQKIYG